MKPSAISDEEAVRDRLVPHEIAADYRDEITGDLNVEASGEGAAPPPLETERGASDAAASDEAAASAGGTPSAAGPATGAGASPAASTARSAASGSGGAAANASAPSSAQGGQSGGQANPAVGPPAPAPGPRPAPQPSPPERGPSGPAPAPPRRALEGEADRTGVTDDTIKIGIHAPVTGAAPLPQGAFEDSHDLYWKFLAEKGGVHGRKVEVVFRDDKYNPTSAVQACREMVEEEKVFAIIGIAGSDQITACARYAESVNVPYFSGGVNEDGLAGLSRYFALSQTYDQQSATLVNLMKKKIRKTKVAIVVISTPALNSTVRSITTEIQRAGGLEIVRSSRIGKYASDAELLSEAQQLRNSGAEVVYVIAAPIPFIKLATNAQAQAYHPTWVGPGTTNGLAVVAQAGCPSIDGAMFLSPFPQLDAIDDLDPDYTRTYRKYVGDNPDDIGILNWGANKTVHQMLEATGRDLSRQSFYRTVTSGRVFHSGVYPDVSYSGAIRFGARTAHLLEADCSSRRWRTTGRFVADF